MLEELHITNIALIDDVCISFSGGLNVLSGETGAGKSIVVDSINLILGTRADKELIKTGEQKAFVEAQFGAPGEEAMIVSRELSRDGRNVCRINGKLVSLSELKDTVGNMLMLYGQNRHQEILEEKNHLAILDSFADAGSAPVYEKVKALYGEYSECRRKLSAMNMDTAEKERTMDLLAYEIGEIDKADLRPGEDEELESEKKLLENAEKLAEELDEAKRALADGGLDAVRTAMKAMEAVAPFDEKYQKTYDQTADLYYQLEEVSYDIAAHADDVVFDPARLEEAGDRLAEINRLRRKYGATIDDILTFRDDAQKKLDELSSIEAETSGLEKRKKELEASLKAACEALSAERRRTAENLSREVVGQLGDLGMEDSSFSARFSEKAPSEAGADEVEFYITVNRGEPEKPLSKVISGGEASRIMLALQNILAKRHNAQTTIYDEIDAGISGRMAIAVAKKMAEISRSRQVICVTHLPQIAAAGDSNYYISKAAKGDRTVTSVEYISGADKEQEVARLSGGISTEASLSHARELIENSEIWKKETLQTV